MEENHLEITLSYLNNKIEDFQLPSTLNEFRTKIKEIFQIKKNIDEIFITYITEEQEEGKEDEQEFVHEVKREEEFVDLLGLIKQEDVVKDSIIYIETDRVPNEVCREFSKNFDQEIELLIKTQLKAAGERIKKGLSGKTELYPSTKIQEKKCFKCNKNIIGDIFKCVEDVDQTIYCKKCSLNKTSPMFIIH